MVKLKTKKTALQAVFLFGGEGEIWTLAPVARPTPLAGAPLHHLSTSPCGEGCCQWTILTSANCKDGFCKAERRFSMKTFRSILEKVWRRGWDSNPRALSDKRFSRPPRYDRFDTPPYMKVLLCSTYDIISYSKRFVKCFCEKSRSFASSFFRHRKSIESSALLCYTEENSFSR